METASPGVELVVLEDRAVAELVPGDHPRDAGPWLMARYEVDLREHRTAVALGQLEPLQSRHHVLVRHRCEREGRTLVADVVPVVELVEAEDGLARGPVLVVRRHVIDRPPAGTVESVSQVEAMGALELAV